MYQELKGNENFSDIYATWVIAYCLDTDSFFATNQRHFFWEYNDEFQCENDAIYYFRNHLEEFRNARKEILSNCGGWSIDKDLNIESQGDLFEDLLKPAKEFDLLNDLALVTEPPKQEISTLKKRIKYCKNPMEKKKLEQELNALYKEHKRNRRTI